MKKLQESFASGKDSLIQFISFSIDPEHDSVSQLRNFANRYTSNHESWWFATSTKNDIYKFALDELKANIADPGVDTSFIHTYNFFLLDRERIVRGWYNGLEPSKQEALIKDIPLLMLEKRHKRDFGEYLKTLFSRS